MFESIMSCPGKSKPLPCKKHYVFSETSGESRDRINKGKPSFRKSSLSGRTCLSSMMLCFLQLSSGTATCADEYSEFIGVTNKESEIASGFNGAVEGGTYTRIIGGKAESHTAIAKNNTVNLDSQYIINKKSDFNSFDFGYKDEKFFGIVGAFANPGNADNTDSSVIVTGNVVNFAKNASVTADDDLLISGGVAGSDKPDTSVTATFNHVKIDDADLPSKELIIMGGRAGCKDGMAVATNNSLDLKYSKNVKMYSVIGGCAFSSIKKKAVANNNGIAKGQEGSLNNVSLTSFTGGVAYVEKGDAIADKNNFSLSNGSAGSVNGGIALILGADQSSRNTASASFNTITLTNYTVRDTKFKNSNQNASDIKCGDAELLGFTMSEGKGDYSATASNNCLALYNVDTTSNVYGGKATAKVTNIKATAKTVSNRVDIYGGKYKGFIYAGYSKTDKGVAVSSDNIVSLWSYKDKCPGFDENTAEIWGGISAVKDRQDKSRGNILEFHEVQNMTAANIGNFSKFIFELPDMKAGETVMTLTGGKEAKPTVIVDAVVEVQKLGELKGSDGGEFKIGDKIYLLKNLSGLDARNIVCKPISVQKGFFEYTYVVKTDKEDRGDTSSLYLTRTEEPTFGLIPGIKDIFQKILP